MKKLGIFAAVLAGSPMNLSAQSDELPPYAYDMVAEITMATTAASTCDGAKLNDRKLQRAMIDLMGRLAGDGLDPLTSMQHFETEAGQAQITLREVALRERHGVTSQGADALCEAIRAELETNEILANMLKLR